MASVGWHPRAPRHAWDARVLTTPGELDLPVVVEVMHAADVLCLKELVTAAGQLLGCYVDLSSIEAVLSLSLQFGLGDLRERCVEFVRLNARVVDPARWEPGDARDVAQRAIDTV